MKKIELDIINEQELILLDMALGGFIEVMKVSTISMDIALKNPKELEGVEVDKEAIRENLNEAKYLIQLGEGLLQRMRELEIEDPAAEIIIDKPDWLKWEEAST